MIRILSLILVSTAFAQAEGKVSFEKIVRYQEGVAGHSIEVSIHQGDYDFTGHKFTGGLEDSTEPAKIDGVEVAGTDGRSPLLSDPARTVFETVREVRLKWDGVDIAVPKSLHITLFSLTLDHDDIQFIPRPSGTELLIQASGGDGGASYLTSIVLRKDGNHIQYPPIYWEQVELPEFPFIITRFSTGNGQVDSEVEEIPWLKSKEAEQAGTGQPATRPESKSEGGDKSQPEAEGRSR